MLLQIAFNRLKGVVPDDHGRSVPAINIAV